MSIVKKQTLLNVIATLQNAGWSEDRIKAHLQKVAEEFQEKSFEQVTEESVHHIIEQILQKHLPIEYPDNENEIRPEVIDELTSLVMKLLQDNKTASKKKSGTWAFDKSAAHEVKQILENLKDDYWNKIGDDLFYDGIDQALKRLEDLPHEMREGSKTKADAMPSKREVMESLDILSRYAMEWSDVAKAVEMEDHVNAIARLVR